MTRPTASSWRLTTRAVFLVIAAVVFVEAVLVLVVFRLGPAPFIVDDERVYHQLAVNLLERGTLSYATEPPFEPSYWRSPGFPSFIAAVYAIAGRSPYAVRVVQFAFLALCSFLLFQFAKSFVSERAAFIAALACATYSPLIFMSALYGSELAAFPFLMWAVLLTLRLRRSEDAGIPMYILLGLVVGALTMIRPVFGLIILPMAILAAGRRPVRRWLSQLIVAGIGFLLLAVPWLVRNSIRVGEPTGAGPSGWELYVSAQQWSGEISCRLLKPEFDRILSEFSRRNEEAAIRLQGTPPPGVSRLMLQELAVSRDYAQDTPRVLRQVRLRDIPVRVAERIYWLWSTCDTSPWSTGLFHRFVQLWHVLLFGAATAGIFVARRSLPEHMLIWLVPVYLTAMHFVFHVESRYTLLARPFVFIYAGVAVEAAIAKIRATLHGAGNAEPRYAD